VLYTKCMHNQVAA